MKKLFLALPFLLAGCQSGRVAFQFQPVAPTGSAAPRGRPAAPTAADTLAVAAPVATTEKPGQPEHRRFISRPSSSSLTGAEAALTKTSLVPAALAGEARAGLVPIHPRALRPLALRRLVRQRATAGPARTAESGLGGIALFFIGVVLALLAGLGALVSLIFGTGFFTGVGFAAAGLVVLFLLYSLLSGGSKKAKAK